MAALPDVFEQILSSHGLGRAVVFDADGTLWRGDVGEDFLRYLSAGTVLPREAKGLYARYEALLENDPAAAYAFCATVMEGLNEVQLIGECGAFFDRRFANRVFPYVRPLLARLQAAGFSIWVCSASPRWVVQAGAFTLGIPHTQVIGVDVEVEKGRLTGRLKPPVPCGPGKVVWLQQHGVKPVLAVGNGQLDIDMLGFAEQACVVTAVDGDTPPALLEAAKARGWGLLHP
ncbi:MAG: haloacid dehalogenase-like hydrolase [Archangium sp.]|nr:haloacid dehalogenase-like hydrolase [Archangium sp.]